MQLRFATVGAAEGWAEVQRAVSPYVVTSEEAVLHEMAHHTATLARYVVVENRQVLGLARVRAYAGEDLGAIVQVHPDHQDRGVGRALFDRVLDIADGRAVRGLVNGEDRSLAVAAHWGFVREREHFVSAVSPGDASAPPAAPSGVSVVPLDEVGPEATWACHEAAAVDDPSGLSRSIPFAEFRDLEWADPRHRADLGRAVVEHGEVVAYSQVLVSGERAWNAMTCTLPNHRGQGLAFLAKAHVLATLADAGVTACSTGNDAANAPMLAVNHRLGYRPSASTWSVRRLAGPVVESLGPLPNHR